MLFFTAKQRTVYKFTFFNKIFVYMVKLLLIIIRMKPLIPRLAIVSLIQMVTAMTANAENPLSDICRYSGDQRADLEATINAAYSGRSISELSDSMDAQWERVGVINPAVLYDDVRGLYANSDQKQFYVFSRKCSDDHQNVTEFNITAEVDSGNTSEIELVVLYADTDFSKRGEALNAERYWRYGDLLSAVRALKPEIKNEESWDRIMTDAGFVEQAVCTVDGVTYSSFEAPHIETNTLSYKIGVQLVPNRRPVATAVIDSAGHIIEFTSRNPKCL